MQVLRIGSGFLADAYLRSDPPVDELEKVRRHVAGTLRGPRAAARGERRGRRDGDLAAPARWRRAGARHARARDPVLYSTPIPEVARRFELDTERVRLLPAGILVLEAISDLGLPLRIARGGLREGVLLELVEGTALLHDPLQLGGAQQHVSSPSAIPARPPFFMLTRAPVRSWTASEKSDRGPPAAPRRPGRRRG